MKKPFEIFAEWTYYPARRMQEGPHGALA